MVYDAAKVVSRDSISMYTVSTLAVISPWYCSLKLRGFADGLQRNCG